MRRKYGITIYVQGVNGKMVMTLRGDIAFESKEHLPRKSELWSLTPSQTENFVLNLNIVGNWFEKYVTVVASSRSIGCKKSKFVRR